MANNLDSLLKEIESKAHIEEIISDYVHLEKRGNNFVGLCPFHDDKSPSMSVSPNKKIFKCFSCGAKGNMYSFVQNYLGINFIDAVKKIADKYNVDWKGSINTKKDTTPQEIKDIWEINKEAKNFFKYMLTNELADTKSRVNNYIKTRKLTQEDIFAFEIGYAPKDSSLINFLKSKGFSETQIINAGIAKLNPDGTISSYFIDRLMFTIKDSNGNTVAFSGRTIENSTTYVKYLNSPETKAFKKSEVLFNFSNARTQISLKKLVIVVEGYMDVISYFNKGFENVVATMGTAFSKNHLELIKPIASEVVLSFDSDAAGTKATIDTGKVLYKNGIKTKVFKVEGYKDVDEYFANLSEDQVKEKLNGSIDFVEFLVLDFIKTYPVTPDFIKLDELVAFIKSIKSESQKQFYLAKLTNKYEIDVNELNVKNKKVKEDEAISAYAASKEYKSKKSEGHETLDDISYATGSIHQNEALLLAYGLASNDSFVTLVKSNYIFDNKDYKAIFEKYKSQESISETPSLSYEMYDVLEKIQQKSLGVKDPANKIIQVIDKLTNLKLKKAEAVLAQKIENLEDPEEIERQANIISAFKKKG